MATISTSNLLIVVREKILDHRRAISELHEEEGVLLIRALQEEYDFRIGEQYYDEATRRYYRVLSFGYTAIQDHIEAYVKFIIIKKGGKVGVATKKVKYSDLSTTSIRGILPHEQF